MVNMYDAFEHFRKQQKYINEIMNPLAIQAFKAQREIFTRMPMAYLDLEIIKPNIAMAEINQNFIRRNSLSPLLESIRGLNKLQLDLADKCPEISRIMFNDIAATTRSLNLFNLFDDVTFDSLSVLNDILNDINIDTEFDQQEGPSDLQSTLEVNSPDLVGTMTRDEFRAEITDAFQMAYSGVNKEITVEERIRSFFVRVLNSLGDDIAKAVIWSVFGMFIAYLVAIATNNHDYNVAKQISEKINEYETVKTVKKAFAKNPDVEQPLRDMAFLRIECHLRTRPSKQSHLASKEPVPRNTVVFPTQKKGNWILVEVETKDDVYIGWVEESKVIKFKVEKMG